MLIVKIFKYKYTYLAKGSHRFSFKLQTYPEGHALFPSEQQTALTELKQAQPLWKSAALQQVWDLVQLYLLAVSHCHASLQEAEKRRATVKRNERILAMLITKKIK
jgi:hypothetical protein